MLNERRFTRTGMTDYSDELALINLHVDIVKRSDFKRCVLGIDI